MEGVEGEGDDCLDSFRHVAFSVVGGEEFVSEFGGFVFLGDVKEADGSYECVGVGF